MIKTYSYKKRVPRFRIFKRQEAVTVLRSPRRYTGAYMHEMGVFWLRVAIGLYAVGLVDAIVVLLRKKSDFFRFAVFAFLVGAIFHLVAIVELATAIGHLPVDNFYESSSLCAFLIAVLFLLVYWKYN